MKIWLIVTFCLIILFASSCKRCEPTEAELEECLVDVHQKMDLEFKKDHTDPYMVEDLIEADNEIRAKLRKLREENHEKQ